jgi:SAM-dependent methyltransferase
MRRQAGPVALGSRLRAVARAHRIQLRRCVVCASAVTSGDAEPDLHDSGAYRPGRPRLHAAAAPALHAFDRQRLSLLRRLAAPPARVVDAVAGRGRFVAAARDAGYDAFGLEPSARGADGAAAFGVEIRRASIHDPRIAEASIDAVTLWHVLEHLPAPGEALTQIAAWLRPGGGLLLAVPNLASLQARVGGERWYHIDVPRHRVHFTPAGLELILRAHGFTILSTHHLLMEHNPFGMWQSAVNRITANPSYLYNLLKRNAPVRSRDLPITALALPLAPIAVMAELLAGLARRGARSPSSPDGGSSGLSIGRRGGFGRPEPDRQDPSGPNGPPASQKRSLPHPPFLTLPNRIRGVDGDRQSSRRRPSGARRRHLTHTPAGAGHRRARGTRPPAARGSPARGATIRVWKEAALAECSVTPTNFSAGWVSSRSRCRAPSGSRGPITRSSWPST